MVYMKRNAFMVAIGYILSRSKSGCEARHTLMPAHIGGYESPKGTRTTDTRPMNETEQSNRPNKNINGHKYHEQGIFGGIPISTGKKTYASSSNRKRENKTTTSTYMPRGTHREEEREGRIDNIPAIRYRSIDSVVQSAMEGEKQREEKDNDQMYSLSPEGLRDGIAAVNVLTTYYSLLVQKKGMIEGIKPITGILVYPAGNGVYMDYWGMLKFTMNEHNTLVDDSGYFVGYKVSSKEEIIRQGYLSEIGFYQLKSTPEEEMNNNYIAAKMLIQEISNETKKDIDTLHKEKIGLDFISGMQEYYERQQRKKENQKSCLTICICSNSSCTGPCKSIKCIEPIYLI